MVSSGGGTNAISELLKTPGASKTILETYIPYSMKSMDLYINKTRSLLFIKYMLEYGCSGI